MSLASTISCFLISRDEDKDRKMLAI